MNPMTRRWPRHIRLGNQINQPYMAALLGAACWLLVACVCSAQESPKLIGSASCATATCHGGVVGIGPAWHSSSSVWEARDPHAHAGEVLFNELSQRIVLALEPTAKNAAVRDRVLAHRCASCHAPEAASSPQGKVPLSTASTDLSKPVSSDAANKSLLNQLHQGVSCEACHGPASNWLTPHTRADWPTLDRALRYSPQSGMLDTESIVSRVDNCARCHVGSRNADGMVRDMNHDMIAAGHPPLAFDIKSSHARLQPHWDATHDALQLVLAENKPQAASAVRDRVLLAAVRLSLERSQRSQRLESVPTLSDADTFAPQPELSEYDCVSCHRPPVANTKRPSRGLPRWQPWYTSGASLADLPAGIASPAEDLVWGKENLMRFLSGSVSPLDQRSLLQLQPAQAPESVRGIR